MIYFIFFVILIGELLGVLCKVTGVEVYDRCREQILNGIRSNLERNCVSLGLSEDSLDSPTSEQPESIMFGSPNTSARLIERVSYVCFLNSSVIIVIKIFFTSDGIIFR